MEALSVRDYRNNLAASFDKAAKGEKVLIRRKNTLYALVSIGKDESTLSPAQKKQLDQLGKSIKRSWKQIQQIESGELPVKSAISFIDEL